MFAELLQDHQLFLILVARLAAFFLTAPVLSSSAIPGIARGGLIVFTAVGLLQMAKTLNYPIPENGLDFALLLVLEIMIGLVMALLLQLVFAIFQVAGQVFSVQMGFGASTTYDPLAQVEMPLVGQLYYLMGIWVFIAIKGLQKIFFLGFYQSFQAMKGIDILLYPDYLKDMFLGALSNLFGQAMIIAFPMMGTLLMVSLTMGLLAKAAPQMNLLMIGFPIQITVGFVMIYLSAPFLVRKMEVLFDWAMELLRQFFTKYGGAL